MRNVGYTQAEEELGKILIDKCKYAANIERIIGWSLFGLLLITLSNFLRQGFIAGT
jgi:hypothetical protein